MRLCLICNQELGKNPKQVVCSSKCRGKLFRYRKQVSDIPPAVLRYVAGLEGVSDGLNDSKTVSPMPNDYIALERKIEALTEVLKTLSITGAGQATSPVAAASRLAYSPDLPDLDLEIRAAKSDENPSFNIVISMMGIGCQPLESLRSDVLEYGLAKGKFNGHSEQARAILAKRGKTALESVLSPSKGISQASGPKPLKTGFDVPTDVVVDIDGLDFDLAVIN